MGKLCRAAVKTCGSMEKKHYNAQDRAGYSATLDTLGMAALNPRASGNVALLLDVSRLEMSKLCGAAVKTGRSMGKERYKVQDSAGYSATLDAAGMAALNPRAREWRTSSQSKQAHARRSAP